MRTLLFGLCLFTVSVNPAIAGTEMVATTPSGLPDMIFKTSTASDATSRLANQCMNRGLTVVASGQNEVTCQVPMSVLKGALMQALIGNSYSTTPQQYIKFNVAQIGDHARVQANAWVETQMAFGQVRREPLMNDDSHNNLMNFMEAAGAKFVPGTSFPNHVYLGVEAGDSKEMIYNKKKTGGVSIKTLDPKGSLALAGGAAGDILVAINDKTFKNLGEFEKRRRGVIMGSRYKAVVIRDGAPLELELTASPRPTIVE